MASRLFDKIHLTRTPKPDDAKIWRRTRRVERRDTDTRRDLQRTTPPGDDRDLGAGKGRERGERTGMGTTADAGIRHGAQGRASEAGGRRVRTTSRWAALRTRKVGGERVKIERDSKRNGYGWRGGRKEGGNNDLENRRRKRWGGRARLNSNNKRRSLGPEWSMSKVGTPPPYNLDKPHGLMASTNNKNNLTLIKHLYL